MRAAPERFVEQRNGRRERVRFKFFESAQAAARRAWPHRAIARREQVDRRAVCLLANLAASIENTKSLLECFAFEHNNSIDELISMLVGVDKINFENQITLYSRCTM